ncbi:DNA repair protein XRCC1 like protein [Argiope bruennichi]|uniref:DNA repair protein XRCC1 n=1 Tax=Argiope bruennichi TaxID=94029 RepID=A0A8T0FN07_ARGBR|nr:DNA repair protein XRCC1 like protein [Argiope bruennichi]
MPEIKIKHVVSFSSEDKIHRAENILKAETYRKWKCATPGEKSASIVLQFEKATQIHSIDIGNESSAFVEVLVGRSSDTVNDYQVLLVASSFMSPLESRNETHTNRVRMFGPDKLSQNLKDEKWDCVQVVCTQPFNKNIQYGLSFIKFHSPPEKNEDKAAENETKNATVKFGAFRIKYEDEDEDNSPPISSWQERKNRKLDSSITHNDEALSYAAAILNPNYSMRTPQQNNTQKRKLDSTKDSEPPAKKESTANGVNKEKLSSKDVEASKKDSAVPSIKNTVVAKNNNQRTLNLSTNENKPSTSNNKQGKVLKRKPFNKIMENVVFVISGFVNPLRSEIRDKGLEMGAKYKGDWDNTCTHLVCAFINTPKYIQVRSQGGRIVTKDWILDCYKKKVPLDWKLYMLGNYTMDESSSEEVISAGSSEEWSDEEEVPAKKQKRKKAPPKLNGKQSDDIKKVAKQKSKSSSDSDDGKSSVSKKSDVKKVQSVSPKKNVSSFSSNVTDIATKDDSETEDEDALKDYMADTDRDSDSGGNTEDEILKVEKANLKKAASKAKESCEDDSDSSLLPSKVDTSNLPLPELPNIFKRRHFFLFGDFSSNKYHDLQRYITAYNGVIEDYMGDAVKYVITESKWDKNFEEALESNEDLIFVKPEWIFKCHEAQKLVPYQPYIVIPDS